MGGVIVKIIAGEIVIAPTPQPTLYGSTPEKTTTNLPPTIAPEIIATNLSPTIAPEIHTKTPISTLGIGSTQNSPKDGMVIVYVPAGDFLMGSVNPMDGQVNSDELPQHTVYLDAFWIDQTEVTNTQYARCVADHQCIHHLATDQISAPTIMETISLQTTR